MEVAQAVATEGNCEVSDVTTGDIRHRLHVHGTDLRTLPCGDSKKNCWGKENHDIVVFSTCRETATTPTAVLPLFGRCLKQQCSSEVDRSEKCFACGELEYNARACTAPTRCCSARIKPANHRLGNKAYIPPTKKGYADAAHLTRTIEGSRKHHYSLGKKPRYATIARGNDLETNDPGYR